MPVNGFRSVCSEGRRSAVRHERRVIVVAAALPLLVAAMLLGTGTLGAAA